MLLPPRERSPAVICLYLQAPFGVFRTFMSGSFRPTAGFISPSAAYGLLLNVAGIEMRHDDGVSPMSLTSKDLPPLELALGALDWPGPIRHTLFQQLHNYPVGNTGKERAPQTKGNKYNIVPVRREFLSGIRACICARGNPELEKQILGGLAGTRPRAYGLPFLGDNNFLIDRLEPLDGPTPAHWLQKVQEGEESNDKSDLVNVMRLTIRIDRADLSRTQSALFRPSEKLPDPPQASWIEVKCK